jgi:hypothetical protein
MKVTDDDEDERLKTAKKRKGSKGRKAEGQGGVTKSP